MSSELIDLFDAGGGGGGGVAVMRAETPPRSKLSSPLGRASDAGRKFAGKHNLARSGK
jgi:hypothetical protein